MPYWPTLWPGRTRHQGQVQAAPSGFPCAATSHWEALERSWVWFVEYLDAKGMAASTINGHLVALRVVLRGAADAGLIDERTYRRLSRVRVQAMASNHTGN